MLYTTGEKLNFTLRPDIELGRFVEERTIGRLNSMERNVHSPKDKRVKRAAKSQRAIQDEIGLHNIEKGDQRSLLRWIADRINLLGQAIDLDLELIGPVEVESLKWFCLEVCAKNVGRGAIAVTSAETDRTGHWTLGSLVTTVSQLIDIRFLVWAAPEFHEAHIVALKWLDRVTVDEFQVLGVEVDDEFQLITAQSHDEEDRS